MRRAGTHLVVLNLSVLTLPVLALLVVTLLGSIAVPQDTTLRSQSNVVVVPALVKDRQGGIAVSYTHLDVYKRQVDVISTDRHTVKPWFQGRIPFAFNLPELQNSDFSLLGGRMTYLEQTPGAHLIYDARKHHISVFVFQELSLPSKLSDNALQPGKLSFNMETWSKGGLRYFVIGDASAADIDSLAKLFKAAS